MSKYYQPSVSDSFNMDVRPQTPGSVNWKQIGIETIMVIGVGIITGLCIRSYINTLANQMAAARQANLIAGIPLTSDINPHDHEISRENSMQTMGLSGSEPGLD